MGFIFFGWVLNILISPVCCKQRRHGVMVIAVGS